MLISLESKTLNTKNLFLLLFLSRFYIIDRGIGMGVYFSSLSATFIILVLAGCLSIYNIIYYGSDKYDPGPGF